MAFYFAPMEGITNFRYRQIHHAHFPGIDKYYMPFMAPHLKGKIKNKEKNDTALENNEGLAAIPQILTNDAESFIITAKMLKDLGYSEVNLNLGCPSPTVVTKGKGSGFLKNPEALDNFLDQIYGALDGLMDISIKTRLGMESAEEADDIFPLYEKYPISELIIHPRTQKDFYRNKPNAQKYQELAEKSRHRLCYNGNIYTVSDARTLLENIPKTENIMIGRGLLRNPALVREIKGGPKLTKKELISFHDDIYAAYQDLYSGPSAILGHMKELWVYTETILTECEKPIKAIRKAKKLPEYEAAVRTLFADSDISDSASSPRETKEVKL